MASEELAADMTTKQIESNSGLEKMTRNQNNDTSRSVHQQGPSDQEATSRKSTSAKKS